MFCPPKLLSGLTSRAQSPAEPPVTWSQVSSGIHSQRVTLSVGKLRHRTVTTARTSGHSPAVTPQPFPLVLLGLEAERGPDWPPARILPQSQPSRLGASQKAGWSAPAQPSPRLTSRSPSGLRAVPDPEQERCEPGQGSGDGTGRRALSPLGGAAVRPVAWPEILPPF